MDPDPFRLSRLRFTRSPIAVERELRQELKACEEQHHRSLSPTAQLAKSHNESAAYRKEVDQLRLQIAELKQTNAALYTTATSSEQKGMQLQKQLQQVNAQLVKATEEAASSQTRLVAQSVLLVKSTDETAANQKQIERLTAQNAELKQANDAFEATVASVKQQVLQLQQEKGASIASTETKDPLLVKIDQLTLQNAELSKANGALTATAASAKQKSMELETRVEQFRQAITSISAAAESSTQRRVQIEKDMASASSFAAQVQTQLHADIDKCEKARQAAIVANELLMKRVQNLQVELGKCQKNLEDEMSAIAPPASNVALQTTIAKLNETIRKLNELETDCKNSLVEKTAVHDLVQKQLTSCRSAKTVSETTITDLKASVKEVKDFMNKTVLKFREAKTELSDIQRSRSRVLEATVALFQQLDQTIDSNAIYDIVPVSASLNKIADEITRLVNTVIELREAAVRSAPVRTGGRSRLTHRVRTRLANFRAHQ